MINLQTIDVPLSFVNAKNALSLPFLTTDTNTIEPYLGGEGGTA